MVSMAASWGLAEPGAQTEGHLFTTALHHSGEISVPKRLVITVNDNQVCCDYFLQVNESVTFQKRENPVEITISRSRSDSKASYRAQTRGYQPGMSFSWPPASVRTMPGTQHNKYLQTERFGGKEAFFGNGLCFQKIPVARMIFPASNSFFYNSQLLDMIMRP